MPREITRSILLPVPPAQAFALLHTPSSIRAWWGARGAIVIPRTGGLWAATWGSEDEPEYVSAARISDFSPPDRLLLTDFFYQAPEALPFDGTDLTTEFVIDAAEGGSRLRVVQRGFPDDAVADDFLAACERGWDATLDGISRLVQTVARS